MLLGTEVGLSQGEFVLDGDPAPLRKRGRAPSQFSAHFYCGQTNGYIKMPLGVDVGLNPGDFVLDGDPVFPPQRWRSPAVEHRSLADVLSLSCARLVADG